ncbi:hypothetical protein ABPG75_002386 [Micractinium tetrahymenae]
MVFSEDVLALCAGAGGASGHSPLGDETPGALDCAARQKRQRLGADGSAGSAASAASAASVQQHWAAGVACSPPPPAAHGAAAAPADAPAAASLAALAAAAHMVPWQASYLLDYVQRCLEALTSMHPVCAFIRTDTKAAELACAIFRRVYLSRSSAERATLLRERFLAQALLVASLWIAVKFEATRTTTPDAKIMSRITGIPGGFLLKQEGDILMTLQWDIMPLARQVGAAGCVDLSDRPALEQQLQLAALTQRAQLAALAQQAQQAQKQAAALHIVAEEAQPASAAGLSACVPQ